ASQVVVGPNPTTNRVTINYTGTEAGPFTVQLLTQFGQVMSAPVSFTGNTYTLDLTGRTPGVYMIRLINTRTNTMIQKQIVKL
ncbi:MAG: T9SS type A sorting domain-containing protein, partial [Chitinophagaceae bacterium]